MLWLLRGLYIGILLTMGGLIGWASLQQPIFGIPAEVTGNPWFIATLFDAYFAFITFYVWVAWKEPRLGARVLWFVSVILWGNFAMSIYLLGELFRIDHINRLREVVTQQREGRIGLPLAFTVTGVGAYLLGAGPLFS